MTAPSRIQYDRDVISRMTVEELLELLRDTDPLLIMLRRVQHPNGDK
jgi:hypothetical protein